VALPTYVYMQPVAVLATSDVKETPALNAPLAKNYIKLNSIVPIPAAEIAPLNQVLIKTFSATPVISQPQLEKEYRDLGEALTQMTELDEGSEWGIDPPVYHAACFVAAGLMINSFPAPRIFNHGSKSVVFNWSDKNNNNLYLTVSADRISALVSTPERIKKRLDYSSNELLNYRSLLGSIRSAQLQQPILMLASGTSDPPESVG